MAQHDYDIANQSGANFRADLNNALDAIVSNNSGSSEPSTKFAYEWWIDTSNNLLKLRNSANNAWITLPLSITADNATSGALTVNGNLSTTGTLDVNGGEIILDADADTSITADTDDQIDFKIGNVDVATLTNSNLVLKGTTPTLTIGDAGAEDTKIVFDGNAQDFYIGLDDSADDLVIGTGSTVGTNGLVVIENSGNVGINTLTPTFRLDVNGSLSSNGNENVMRIAGSDTNNAGGITINNVFGASASARVSTLFSIDGQDQASPLAFGNGTTEGMRLDNGGSFFFNKTAHAFATEGVEFLNTNVVNMTRSGGTILNIHRTSSDGTMVEFFKDSGQVGSISTNSNSLPSDRNFKRDISDLNLGLDLITKLKPSQYNYKIDDADSPKMYGLIAQDLEESLTKVGIEKNSTWLLQHNPKDDEKQSDFSLDYIKLIPILINSIKELEAKIKKIEG
jgi:hypothetical protein